MERKKIATFCFRYKFKWLYVQHTRSLCDKSLCKHTQSLTLTTTDLNFFLLLNTRLWHNTGNKKSNDGNQKIHHQNTLVNVQVYVLVSKIEIK